MLKFSQPEAERDRERGSRVIHTVQPLRVFLFCFFVVFFVLFFFCCCFFFFFFCFVLFFCLFVFFDDHKKDCSKYRNEDTDYKDQ